MDTPSPGTTDTPRGRRETDARPEVRVSRGVGTDGSSVVTAADARLLRRLAKADAYDDDDDVDDDDGGEKAEQQRGGATSGVRRRRRRIPSSGGGGATPIIIVGDDPVVSSSPRCLILSDERMECFGDAIIAGPSYVS
jgi:hypothetical protein